MKVSCKRLICFYNLFQKIPEINYSSIRHARFNEKNEPIDVKEFYSSNDYLSHETQPETH
jgi:hypothetical protein